jgi:hypothetical protein
MLTEVPMVYRQYNTDDVFTANICGKLYKDIMRHAENNNSGKKNTDPWTGTNITVLKPLLFRKTLHFTLRISNFLCLWIFCYYDRPNRWEVETIVWSFHHTKNFTKKNEYVINSCCGRILLVNFFIQCLFKDAVINSGHLTSM